MATRHCCRVTEQYIQGVEDERRERALEKIFLGETELEFYDCSCQKYSDYTLPRLFPSGLLSVELCNGDLLDVSIKTEYIINTSNLHKEIHCIITNGEENRAILMKSIEELKYLINLNYGKYINRIVKEEWEIIAKMVRAGELLGFDGYGFQVYTNSISTLGLKTFSDVLKKSIKNLNSEERIALADVIVEQLNTRGYHKNGIDFSYIRDGAYGGRVRLQWNKPQNKVDA